VHAGALFDVFRAALGNWDVAIKRHIRTTQWDTALATAWRRTGKTYAFHRRQMGWADDEPPPEPAYFEALLRAEHAVIERAGSDWNHPGAQLARWLPDDRLAPVGLVDERGADLTGAGSGGGLCLVMPWCSGDSFASLPRADQRRLFPAMLPALLTALSACPHGDLSPANLLLDRTHGLFRILDPGVRIPGPSRPGALEFYSELLTTNAIHYPLLMPDHGPGKPRVRAGEGSLLRLLYAAEWFDLRLEPPALPVASPAAADAIACGAIYYGVLAGAPLVSLLGVDAPLWAVTTSTRGDSPDRRHSCLDALAAGAVSRALQPTGATAAEIALCERLFNTETDSETLAWLAIEAARPRG
jgi:hypothetical protein